MLKVALAVVVAGLLHAAAAEPARQAAPQKRDYRSRTIYFVVADRFHASQPWRPYVDRAHPKATNSRNCFAVACPLNEQWRRYWGGDIPGITRKLGYLKRMGVSALWVTPLMENVPGYVPSRVFKGWGTGYHGYWVQNYFRVNPHFGGWSDVQRLSRALHANGMRYIQDITLNDSNPLDTHRHGRLYAGTRGQKVFIKSYDNDRTASGRRMYKHYQDTPQCQEAEKESDVEWTYWQLHHCLLADLAGYDQRVPQIGSYLIAAGKDWLDHGVDDFRLDAVKFQFPEFVSKFTHQMAAHLARKHRPAPYIVGEWSGGGVGSPKSLAFANRYGHFRTRILDFSLALGLNQFVGGSYEDPSQQLDGAGLDRLLHQRIKAFAGRDTWQGTFIDNHDQMRTMVRLQKLHVPEGAERWRRLDLATVLLLTVRGIPIVFYGDEQYVAHYDDGHDTPPPDVNSDNDDPFNRIGMRRWSEKTAGFRIVRVLSRLRAHAPAIWKGSYRTVLAGTDVLVFERRWEGERILVAINRGASTTVELPATYKLPQGRHLNLLSGTSAPNTQSKAEVAADGTITLRLAHLGAIVAR